MSENNLKVGDHVWSDFFGEILEIVSIRSDEDWEFKLSSNKPGGLILKAQTPLSHFKDKKITQ